MLMIANNQQNLNENQTNPTQDVDMFRISIEANHAKTGH
jgi:hypothetical protein